MSTVDLSALPTPEVLESLDFEDAYQEELAVFRSYMGDNWNAALESDPVVKLLELGAYRRLQIAAWINPRRRLGVEIARSAIDAQLHITGVSRVDLPGWVDIPRAKHQAAYCIGYSVTQGGAG